MNTNDVSHESLPEPAHESSHDPLLDPSHETLLDEVRQWAASDPDPATVAEALEFVERAENGDESALAHLRDVFTGRLTFGTAGLRAELGAGPRRMNRVVVSQTTAGFAAFLWERARNGETTNPPSVVIGRDARINSDVFARDAAEIMAGSGIKVTLIPDALPTPITAFAVRHLDVSAGIMVTASHNPPRDNGYKVYLGDADAGSQITPPADTQIAAYIEHVAEGPVAALPRSTDYTTSGPEIVDAYIGHTARAARIEGANRTGLVVAYTAMHGVGAETTRRVFEAAGLPRMHAVEAQNQPDGTFPTVDFPNPEEPGALDLAVQTATGCKADLIVAHDPDADRLAVALPDTTDVSGYRRLTGNDLGLLLGWRAAERHRRLWPDAPGTLACTNVSSPALGAVAAAYGLEYAETLSGFKWVSRVPNLVFGFEEALGYLAFPDVVHDKDGISAGADIVALACELAAEGRTLWDRLDEASERFGHFASSQVVVRLESMAAVETLSLQVRQAPPAEFDGVAVAEAKDLLTPGLAAVPANVLRYDLVDGSRVMVRPSGTEPKLKIYIDTFSEDGDARARKRAAEAMLGRVESSVRDYLASMQTA